MDVRANESTPANVDRLNELKSAGIPMRTRTANGIMHYKLMIFAGQSIVEFSGANFSANAWCIRHFALRELRRRVRVLHQSLILRP